MNVTKVWWFVKTKLMAWRYGSIGKHSYVGKPIYIQRPKNILIGNNVRIYPGMRAELTKPGAKIVFGDNVSVGQGFHIVSFDEELVISHDTTISGNVFISNVDHDYSELGVHVLNQKMIKKQTQIGENCFIGFGARFYRTILGRQCIVGANAVVKGIFEDYCVIAGNPARIVKKYNIESGKWEHV